MQFVVLAWILTRADFGLVSMLGVVTVLAQMLGDMGIGNAIIHRQDTSPEELSSLFWLNMLAGGVLFGTLFLTAPLVAGFFNQPQLVPLVRLASTSFLIAPLGQQFEVLLARDLRFKPLALVDIGAAGTALLVAISVALTGGGATSLVWGQLAAATVKASLLGAFGMRQHPIGLHFMYKDVKTYLSFGLYQMGERIVNYASARVDVILIGRYLGADVLGVYSLAYQLVLMPLARINPILTRVALPVFAKRQMNDYLRRGYLELVKLLSILVFPMALGVAITAPVAIPYVLGDKWRASAAIIPTLSVIGLTKALGNPIGVILLAKGRADVGFWWNVFVLVVNTLTFSWVVTYGLYPFTWAYACLSIVYLLCILAILRALLQFKWRAYLSALTLATTASTAMVLATGAIYITWPQDAHALPEIIVLVATGCATYLLSLYLLDKGYVGGLFATLRSP